jgi:hypothetical protein
MRQLPPNDNRVDSRTDNRSVTEGAAKFPEIDYGAEPAEREAVHG